MSYEILRKNETEYEVQQRIKELCENIDKYLDIFENNCPFNPRQREYHIKTIHHRFRFSDVISALKDDIFIRNLWETLRVWGLGTRGSKLLCLNDFKKVLLEHKEYFSELDSIRIDDKNISIEKVSVKLWDLMNKARVSRVKNPIVSGSKCFHHILPNLVPPIDREYTRPFFKFWLQYFQNNPRKAFIYMWKKFVLISYKVNLDKYVGKTKWCTSITKVLDNAIIGYCKCHNIPKLR